MILTKRSRNTPWMSNRDVKGGSRSFTTLPPSAPSGTRTPNPLSNRQHLPGDSR